MIPALDLPLLPANLPDAPQILISDMTFILEFTVVPDSGVVLGWMAL